MKLALAFTIAATAATAQAEWNPPPRYDTPYAGDLHTMPRPPAMVAAACAGLFAWADLDIQVSMEQRGCAVYNGRECWVIHIDRDAYGTTPEAVLRHEIGHCNGWPANHPGM